MSTGKFRVPRKERGIQHGKSSDEILYVAFWKG